MKKYLTLAVCLLILLSLLVGCGNTTAPAETPTETTTETTPKTTTATPGGTLLLSMGDTYELVYDAAGKILEVNGTSENSKKIAADLQQQVGRDCVYGARALMNYYISQQLLDNIKTMAVRVGFGDPLPSEDFLTTCVNDTQLLAFEEDTAVQIVEISGSSLDDKGLLLPETAKKLAALHLGVTPEELTGEDTVEDNLYTYSFDEMTCIVDAFTGLAIEK